MATRKNKLAADFCRCIKKVRKTIKLRPGVKKTSTAKEAAAIAVCVQSVLQTRGKTLKRFRCGKKQSLTTQEPLRGGYTDSSQPQGAPYQSTDPTASRIQPGSNIQSYYHNAVNAPVRLG